MKHIVSSLLLALAFITTGTACSAESPHSVVYNPVVPPEPQILPEERRTAVKIATISSVCSATKLAVQTILSASHCFRTATRTLLIDGQPAIIERVMQDNNDHALVLLSGITLSDFAVIGNPAKEGDNIHYWGNPLVFTMLLRRGYVSGYQGVNTLYDVNGYKGDSGAGIFNEKNQLVGVISYIRGEESFAMMGSYPLNFTAEQLKAVRLPIIPLLMTGIKADVRLSYSD